MSSLSRVVSGDLDHSITCIACDERFVIIGHEEGTVTVLYHRKGARVFVVKVSNVRINSVCCEERDEDDNPIFYAGANDGKVVTLNRYKM